MRPFDALKMNKNPAQFGYIHSWKSPYLTFRQARIHKIPRLGINYLHLFPQIKDARATVATVPMLKISRLGNFNCLHKILNYVE